jgi:hypothetical protein
VLGRDVRRTGHRTGQPADRGHVDHRTAAGPAHRGQHRPAQPHGTGQVDRDHPIPGGVVELGDGNEVVHDAGVVHQHVDTLADLGHDPLDIGLDRDVGPDRFRVVPRVHDRLQRLRKTLRVHVRRDDPRALPGEADRRGPTDTGTGARDQHDASRMPARIHRVPSIRRAFHLRASACSGHADYGRWSPT